MKWEEKVCNNKDVINSQPSRVNMRLFIKTLIPQMML